MRERGLGLVYWPSMERSDWDRLAAPFLDEAIDWRVQEIAEDRGSARLRAHLQYQAVRARLDDVVGREGWSFRFRALGTGICCELEVSAVVKSAIVEPVRAVDGPEACGHAAFALAAEHFGLLPPVDPAEVHWVDYDPEDGSIAPEFSSPQFSSPEFSERLAPANQTPEPSVIVPEERPEPSKPAGQQAIDRLVERLKYEGSGLAAARLLVQYGGYGTDPQAARALYGKLRELLARQVETTQ